MAASELVTSTPRAYLKLAMLSAGNWGQAGRRYTASWRNTSLIHTFTCAQIWMSKQTSNRRETTISSLNSFWSHRLSSGERISLLFWNFFFFRAFHGMISYEKIVQFSANDWERTRAVSLFHACFHEPFRSRKMVYFVRLEIKTKSR